jgi:hypothetical protein
VRWRRGLGIGEAVNERRRGGFLTGRGGQTEALRGAATVAPSFRLVVEREQQGRRASVWDDECGGSVDRRVAHRWAEFGRCGRGATTRQRRRKGARDGDLAGVRQLVDRLRCEGGGDAVDGCRRELSAVATRKALDVGGGVDDCQWQRR